MPTQEPSITLVSKDGRGEIYSILLPGDRELMLLHSKKGTLRGGHSHDVPEVVMVLSGKMRYHKIGVRHNANPQGRLPHYSATLGEGSLSGNAAGQVHMGEFLEDTWLIELKHAKKGEWTQKDYEPWRAKVRANAGV